MWWLRHAAELRAGGIALLALAVVWPLRARARLVVAAAGGVALVASAWGASFDGRDLLWAAVLSVGVAVALWWAGPYSHRALDRFGGAWWVLLGSAAAVYGCVPETDQMREVAVVVAAGGIAELLLRRQLPTPALVAAAALVEWSALFGATGQPRAIVGGLFALTPLIAVAVVSTRSRPSVWWLAWSVAAVWVVAALVVARTGGIATLLTPAVVAASVGGLVALGLSAVLRRLAHR